MKNGSHHLSLKLMQQCPACKKAIQEDKIFVLSESQNEMVAHVSCPSTLREIRGTPSEYFFENSWPISVRFE